MHHEADMFPSTDWSQHSSEILDFHFLERRHLPVLGKLQSAKMVLVRTQPYFAPVRKHLLKMLSDLDFVPQGQPGQFAVDWSY